MSFMMKERLISHQTTVHEKEKPFKCEICQNSFRNKCLLNRHEIAVHENEKPLKCEICQKCFGYKAYFKSLENRKNIQM